MNITAEQIAKIAEWMGRKDVRCTPTIVTYRPWPNLSNRVRFDPINDPADAWQVLEHVTHLLGIEARIFSGPVSVEDPGSIHADDFTCRISPLWAPFKGDIDPNYSTSALGIGTRDTPAAALCAAVLEMIDEPLVSTKASTGE